MKIKELFENFDNIFTWNKNEIKENKSEIDDLMKQLLEKRKS